MKPRNWGLTSFAMLAGAFAVGMALAGTVGKLLDPLLSRIEGAMGTGVTA